MEMNLRELPVTRTGVEQHLLSTATASLHRRRIIRLFRGDTDEHEGDIDADAYLRPTVAKSRRA
jgi:hypothetical protein